MSKKLFRSRKNKMIFGLAGGLGEYLEVDPTIIRILFVIFSFFFWNISITLSYNFYYCTFGRILKSIGGIK